MKSYTINAPQQIDATIELPASKSISNRALIIYALSHGGILPKNLSDCDDTEVIIAALKNSPDIIDIKAAGTAMRFMTAFLSSTLGSHTITGTERMQHRPIKILVDALKSLGANISYIKEDGFPPLHITGKQLTGGHLQIPGNISSQYISALLMIGPILKQGLELELSGEIVSRPYINMTLKIMAYFGAEAQWESENIIKVSPKPYINKAYLVENDWSGSSYWYEIMALCKDDQAKIHLTGLFRNSLQGDSVIQDIFAKLGVRTVFEESGTDATTTVTLTKTPYHLESFTYDFTKCPDLAQTVVVTCCELGIKFHFTGLASLKIKETDRIEALKIELRKLGFILQDEHDDTLIWNGDRCEASMAPIDTYEDHRMAMAFAPTCFVHKNLLMNNPQVVSKSYPHFWDDLRQANFLIKQN